MKTKITLIAALTFLSLQNANAVANFSGKWVADSGKVTDSSGALNRDCSKVEIEIVQTETEIITKKYTAVCGGMDTDWGPNHMQIKGDKIWENGEEVGTISEDTLISVTPEGSVSYAFNLKLITSPAGEQTLQSYYGVKGFLGALVTEAEHRKVAP